MKIHVRFIANLNNYSGKQRSGQRYYARNVMEYDVKFIDYFRENNNSVTEIII